MVNGINASFWDKLPSETYAVAWLAGVSLTRPETEAEFKSLSGQSAMRPFDGPAEGSSVERSGLSHVSVLMLLWKNEPSYPRRRLARAPLHSAATPRSVVRVSTGTGSSTALLKPNVPAHGCSPVFCVFLKAALRSRWSVARYSSRKSAMLRCSIKSNCGDVVL